MSTSFNDIKELAKQLINNLEIIPINESISKLNNLKQKHKFLSGTPNDKVQSSILLSNLERKISLELNKEFL